MDTLRFVSFWILCILDNISKKRLDVCFFKIDFLETVFVESCGEYYGIQKCLELTCKISNTVKSFVSLAMFYI